MKTRNLLSSIIIVPYLTNSKNNAFSDNGGIDLKITTVNQDLDINNYIYKDTDDDYDEVDMMNSLTASRPKVFSFSSVNTTLSPIQVFKGEYYVKIKNALISEKINLRILDEFGFPVYLRQLAPDATDTTLVDISNWYVGVYSILFTNASGMIISEGKFEVK